MRKTFCPELETLDAAAQAVIDAHSTFPEYEVNNDESSNGNEVNIRSDDWEASLAFTALSRWTLEHSEKKLSKKKRIYHSSSHFERTEYGLRVAVYGRDIAPTPLWTLRALHILENMRDYIEIAPNLALEKS